MCKEKDSTRVEEINIPENRKPPKPGLNNLQKKKKKLAHTGCLKIREFRIRSVVGKDPVELEKYFEKKFALPEDDISTLILFNTLQSSYPE
jgi:hypothetical protein